MATVVNFDDENKKNQNPAPTGMGAAPQSPSAPAAPSASTPTTSGRFTNIQNYFNANKPAADQMGSNVANNIKQSGQEVKDNLNSAQNSFNTQSQSGRLEKTPSITNANNIITNAGQQVYGNGTAPNSSVVNQFQRYSSGEYLGPKELENTGGLLAKAQDARTQGDLSATSPGRFTLLRNMFGTPTYSSGQTSLDNLLLGNQSGKLNQARQNVMGLPQLANQDTQQAQMQAAYYGKEASDVGNTVRNQLGNARTSTETELNKALEDAQTKEMNNQAAYNATTGGIANNTISASDAARLGLGTGSSINTYGVNPLDYIKTNISDVPLNLSTVSNSQQAAQANALARLSGMQGNPIDFDQVGKYSGSTQNIDPDYFNKVQAGKEQFDTLTQQEAAQKARFDNLQGIFGGLSNDRQKAAMAASSGSNPQTGVAAANNSISSDPRLNQLYQELYGGDKARDVGFLNQAGTDLSNQRNAALAALEAQLNPLRRTINVTPDVTKQS